MTNVCSSLQICATWSWMSAEEAMSTRSVHCHTQVGLLSPISPTPPLSFLNPHIPLHLFITLCPTRSVTQMNLPSTVIPGMTPFTQDQVPSLSIIFFTKPINSFIHQLSPCLLVILLIVSYSRLVIVTNKVTVMLLFFLII